MKTTEMLDVEQAFQLVEYVLLRSGDEGEHLVVHAGSQFEGRQAILQRGMAARKSLLAAKGLLGVAFSLMTTTDPMSNKQWSAQTKATLENLRRAARTAYEASHMLAGLRQA